MADSRVNIILGARDEASKTVTGLRGQMEMFKRDALAGFGLGAGIGVFNLASRALGGVADFMGDAIGAASNLEESQSKVNQVFTDSSDVINDWASESARAFGLSEAAALEAAGTFGNFIQALGNTEEEANSMSRTLVELAADLASFNNQDINEVILALRSGLAGEAEPMRRLGVSISATRVEANILAKGIARTKAEITDAMKVAERYAIIMQDTSKAQGDFARTSDGVANQTRILAAETENLQASIGEKLIPYQKAWNEALLTTLDLVGEILALPDGGSSAVGARVQSEQDAMKEFERLASDFGITQDELGRRLWALGQAHRSYAQAMEGVNEVGKDALSLTDEQITENSRMLRLMELLPKALDETAASFDVLSGTVYTAKRRFADFAADAADARARLLAFRDAADDIAETRSLDKINDALRRQRNNLQQAAKAGNVRKFAAATAAIEQLKAEKELRQQGRQALREYRQRTREQKRDQGKVTDSVEETTGALRELDRTNANPTVTVDDAAARTALANLQARLNALAFTHGTVTIGASVGFQGPGFVQTKGKKDPDIRAAGGPVSAYDTYLIGERGPELLHMGSQSGHITPNHQLGSSGPTVVVMDGRVVGELVDARLGRRSATLGRDGSYRSN